MVHLQDSGYSVEKIDMGDSQLTALKTELGVPPGLESCHTAEVEGYVIEGHVPADVIDDLLAENPELVGLALPGMPPGAPGMGGEAEGPLEILAFDRQGRVWVYARR